MSIKKKCGKMKNIVKHNPKECLEKTIIFMVNSFFGESNPKYGKHWDDEMKLHFREVNGLKVQCVETGVVYLSCQEAADAVGGKKSNIHAVLDKPNNTCKGFHFIRFQEQ